MLPAAPLHLPACPPSPPALQLLGYIKKDKQGDALIEKLCQRFAATEEPAQWHSIAFCLTQVRRARCWLVQMGRAGGMAGVEWHGCG